MLNKKNILLLLLISFALIGLISNIKITYINSIKNLNESLNNIPDIHQNTFLDLNDKKTIDEINLKILQYQSLGIEPIYHISSFDFKEEEEKEAKKLRNLETSNLFENVGLIDPLNDSYFYIMKWISRTIKQTSSNIILYPYSFNYTYESKNEEGENISTVKRFLQGAFISLNTGELEQFNNMGLKTKGFFYAKKARAVFDADFAILSIEYFIDNSKVDVFRDGVDWSIYFQSYYLKGTTSSTFKEFEKYKKQYLTKTYATKINETEIINGNLLNDGLPRFGLLIIPDYLLGTEEIIRSKLGIKGINNIKEYYNKGGKIIVSGKSGILLEDFGLMDKGVYDRKRLLTANKTDRLVKTKGCEDTFEKIYIENENDFEHQMICMSVVPNRQVSLASSFISIKRDNNYNILMNLDSNNVLIKVLKIKNINIDF